MAVTSLFSLLNEWYDQASALDQALYMLDQHSTCTSIAYTNIAEADQMVPDILPLLSAATYLFLIPLSLPSPFTWPRAGGCSVTSMRTDAEA